MSSELSLARNRLSDSKVENWIVISSYPGLNPSLEILYKIAVIGILTPSHICTLLKFCSYFFNTEK